MGSLAHSRAHDRNVRAELAEKTEYSRVHLLGSFISDAFAERKLEHHCHAVTEC